MSLIRRIVFPFRRTPEMERFRTVVDSWRTGVRGADGLRCSSCGGELRADASEMVCADCGLVDTPVIVDGVAQPTDSTRAIVRDRRAAARKLTLFAEIVVIVTSGLAVWQGEWGAMITGAAVAAVVLLLAAVERYRAWQLDNGRLFEARAPLVAFVRSEVRLLLQGGGERRH